MAKKEKKRKKKFKEKENGLAVAKLHQKRKQINLVGKLKERKNKKNLKEIWPDASKKNKERKILINFSLSKFSRRIFGNSQEN